MLPEEEPRAVSPLAKKRSPKRRIDFRNHEQQKSPLTDEGTTSWADMVRNGYQRSNSNTNSMLVKCKENDDNNLSKQKKQNDNKNKDTNNVQGSNNSNSSTNSSRFNKQADQCCTEVEVTRERSTSSNSTITEVTNSHNNLSPCSDKKEILHKELSETIINAREDEGWEVVSRSRGKPSRKSVSKVQSAASTTHTFAVSNDIHNLCTDDHCDVDLDCHGNNDHKDDNSDADHHTDQYDDKFDPDRHGNIDPENSDNYCGGDNSGKVVAKDDDSVGEENNEKSIQGATDSSTSNVDTERAISSYTQVGRNYHY